MSTEKTYFSNIIIGKNTMYEGCTKSLWTRLDFFFLLEYIMISSTLQYEIKIIIFNSIHSYNKLVRFSSYSMKEDYDNMPL